MRILQILGAIFILFASPAMAKDAVAMWVVTQKSGDVRVIRGGLQPASIALRASLAPGDIIATGPNGRAMLTKGEDYVVVAPASRLALPKEQQATGFTRLIQQVGTMLYKVKRTGTPHFAVETPMLAAVVKGTTFSIVVDEKGAAVQVTEGVVEVSSLTGNSRRLVERGMAVYVGRERPNEVIEIKSDAVELPQTVSDEGAVRIEASSDLSLSTVSELTGGLVREAPTTKLVAAAPTSKVVPTGVGDGGATGTVTSVAGGDAAVSILASVDTAVPSATQPAVQTVQAAVPAITQPVIDIVQATVPAITAPVVGIAQAIVPVVTVPVVEIVQATVPAITAPIVAIVQATVPAITAPVVEIIAAVPAITAPIVQTVATVPTVIAPVVAIVQPIIPVVAPVVAPVIPPVAPIISTIPNILCTLLCGR